MGELSPGPGQMISKGVKEDDKARNFLQGPDGLPFLDSV